MVGPLGVQPPCCPPGSLPASEGTVEVEAPLGTTIAIPPRQDGDEEGGMDVYLTGETDLTKATRVVLVFSDVFGLDSGRHKEFADSLAAAVGPGTAVVLPDLFHGTPPGQPVELPFGLLRFTGIGLLLGLPRMVYKLKYTFTKEAVVDRSIRCTLLPFLERSGVDLDKVGLSCVGFCFGGWVVARCLADLSNFRCGVGIHPSLDELEKMQGRSEAALARKVGAAPLLLLPAGNDRDSVQPGGTVVTALAALRGVDMAAVSVPFPGRKHGWVTRGDRSVEAIRRDQDKALDLTAQFVKEHHN